LLYEPQWSSGLTRLDACGRSHGTGFKPSFRHKLFFIINESIYLLFTFFIITINQRQVAIMLYTLIFIEKRKKKQNVLKYFENSSLSEKMKFLHCNQACNVSRDLVT
jgi:hypothetical protein